MLAAASFLAMGLVAPLAKAGTIVVGAPPAATADNVARHLARNLGGSFIVLNKPGFDAASAAREMRGKATDGSELMIVQMNESGAAAGKSPPASEFADLTPVAMLGDIQSTAAKLWFGLFAPPRTPASVVNSLNARVRQLMASVPPITYSTSTVQYAQDMSAGALSQRLATAVRTQPAAAMAAAPTNVPSTTTASSRGAPSGLGATPEQDCPEEQRALNAAHVQEKTGGSWDRYFDYSVPFYNDRFKWGAPRTQDLAWLRQFVSILKPRVHAEGNWERPLMYWMVCKAESRISRLTGEMRLSPAIIANRAQEACQASFENAWNAYLASSPYGTPNKSESFAFWRYQSGANEGCGGNPLIRQKYEGVGNNNDAVGRGNAAFGALAACVQRFLASPQCTAGGSTTVARVDPPRPPSTQQPSNPGTTPTPAPSATPTVTPARPASSGSAGTTSPAGTPRSAPDRAQAQQHQAALDEQRRGKPKRHYAEREAHHCLTLWTEKTMFGGFTNTCDFPVRFVYCAYKPKKGAWTEAFNCEGKTPHVGGNDLIKAHDRGSYHTLGAQKILWFACRADSTKEEIFEVGDGEFDPSGPFIRARCVKWNDRS